MVGNDHIPIRGARAVLFDWDGTLVDTAEASYRCYVRMFASFSIVFDRETYARTYSPNWYNTFRMLGLAEEHWADADARWLEYFAGEKPALIDGAAETLEHLHARGIKTGIVTSGGRDRVSRELETHGLHTRLTECVYGSDVKEKKPHPEGLLLALDRLQTRPPEAVYIGDSAEDIAMARAAGVPSIAIPGPYPNHPSLLAARPDTVAATLKDAMRALLMSSE